jgi:peptidyl-prolyl cis-trans isomerase SurA
LIAHYLKFLKYLNILIKEAFERKKTEVKASHILIKFPKKGIKFDTLLLYKRISNVRNRVLNGESFEKVAKEASEDPSVKINKGNLGYFSAFTMLHAFENAAYNTPLNEVSEPFKTKFGYHILKVTGKRASKGEFEVAHILVKKSKEGKVKIDSLYRKIEQGEKFEEVAKKYSDDKGTASLGGKLPRFGTGRMVENFENNVRLLKQEGDYTKPFKTKFGWHIVKLLKKYPLGTFEEVKKHLTNKVKKSNRASLSKQAILNRLTANYKIKENKKAINVFLTSDIKELKKKNLNKVLLSINNKKIYQKTFLKFIEHKYNKSISNLYQRFKNNQIIEYFKNDLINTTPQYKNTLLEYKEGLLLFNLMQEKIWSRSSKDTLGLKDFYILNKSIYGDKELNTIRGQVINDYQKKIEEDWIRNLRVKNKIKIRERELKKFKKIYNQ